MNGHVRQKEQSAKRIEDALFQLMVEKAFTEITVSELADRADVARRTFYRLYKGKEDVLHGYFGRLCREYQRTFPALKNYHFLRVAEDYFGFWYSHKEVLLLMHQCGLDDMLYCEIGRAATAVVKNRMGSEQQSPEDWAIECFASYSAGGFGLLLQRWVESGMQEGPKHYARRGGKALLHFIRPAVQAESGK